MIDIVMAIVNISFVVGFIPQIIKSTNNKDMGCFSWVTLIISSIGVSILAICFFIIDKPITGIVNALVALCWFYLLGLKKVLDR